MDPHLSEIMEAYEQSVARLEAVAARAEREPIPTELIESLSRAPLPSPVIREGKTAKPAAAAGHPHLRINLSPAFA
jgi:hypothetical protein